MPLSQKQKLHNRYFILRHGYSKANEAAIVLSHPEHGQSEEFTLTEKGEKQVLDSVTMAKNVGLLDANIIIVSSPFSRCQKTAEIARDILGVDGAIILDSRLRERWFGNWERTDNTAYDKVWADDIHNPQHQIESVESAHDVQQRTAELISELEEKYADKKILLVSHGDALQIMQTAFQKKSSAVHRSLQHLETAEVRELFLAE